MNKCSPNEIKPIPSISSSLNETSLKVNYMTNDSLLHSSKEMHFTKVSGSNENFENTSNLEKINVRNETFKDNSEDNLSNDSNGDNYEDSNPLNLTSIENIVKRDLNDDSKTEGLNADFKDMDVEMAMPEGKVEIMILCLINLIL